jgi:hypothetical protein
MSDPLRDLKREIEEESLRKQGLSYQPMLPSAEIELDRVTVPRGENLAGTLCLKVGRRELWLDRIDLFVDGVAKTTGSKHSSMRMPIARMVQVSAGETRRLPLWIPIPADTALGSKQMILLTGGKVGVFQHFDVEPERIYTEVVQVFSSRLGLVLDSWNISRRPAGVYAQLGQGGEAAWPIRHLGIDMSWCEGAMVGELVVDPPCVSMAAALRSLVRPDRRRIPFSLPHTDTTVIAERLAALLLACLRNDLQLPIPTDIAVPSGLNVLPVPSESTSEREQ